MVKSLLKYGSLGLGLVIINIYAIGYGFDLVNLPSDLGVVGGILLISSVCVLDAYVVEKLEKSIKKTEEKDEKVS